MGLPSRDVVWGPDNLNPTVINSRQTQLFQLAQTAAAEHRAQQAPRAGLRQWQKQGYHARCDAKRRSRVVDARQDAGTGLHDLQPGDITHCDFGVTAMGLNTDTQHLGYVLGPGETGSGIPQSVLVGMDLAYWLQETTRKHMKIGMTENDRLQNIRADMQQKGDQDKIYCHAVGEFGHSAGTVTGTHVQLTIKLFCLSSWAKYVSADNFCAHGRNEKSSRRGPLPG